MKKALVVVSLLALGSALSVAGVEDSLQEQVRQAEAAFAKTMADRDPAGFASFLATDTVFFGPRLLRGKAAVAEAWKPFYQGKDAPFSWAPETVAVLDAGDLAFSSGPVFDPTGKRTGTFNSVWHKEKDGKWRIIFDNGCPRCDCAAPPESKKPAGS